MRALIVADLRDAWLAWLAVGLTFVATSFSIALAILMTTSVLATIAAGGVSEQNAPGLLATPLVNLVFAPFVALGVVGAATGLVVQARRGALARLTLAGATPRQVTGILLAELAIVAFSGAVVGDILALVLLPAAMRFAVAERSGEGGGVVIYDGGLVVLATALAVVIALLGGWRQARAASRIAPIEALRAVPGSASSRVRVGGLIVSGLLIAAVAVVAIVIPQIVGELGRDGGDIAMQASVICVLVAGIAVAASGPLIIGAFARLWTAAVPSRSGAWILARATVITKRDRLARTVTPIMFTVAVLVGITAIGTTVNDALVADGAEGLDSYSALSLLSLVGLALIIAITGSVTTLLTMSRQREVELALAAVTGATPRQQVLVGVFEGVIVTVTAVVIGIIIALIGVLMLAAAIGALGYSNRVAIDWISLAVTAVICLLVTVAATTLPALASVQRPPRAVVARLVAE